MEFKKCLPRGYQKSIPYNIPKTYKKYFSSRLFFSELGNIRSHPFLRILALDSEAEINRSKHKREVTGAIIGVWNTDQDHGIDGGAFFGHTFRDRQHDP